MSDTVTGLRTSAPFVAPSVTPLPASGAAGAPALTSAVGSDAASGPGVWKPASAAQPQPQRNVISRALGTIGQWVEPFTVSDAPVVPSNDTYTQVVQVYGEPTLGASVERLIPGKVRLETGTTPFTRTYLPLFMGEGRFRHGSAVPSSLARSNAERQVAQQSGPGRAIDEAAKHFGAHTEVEALMHTKESYDPSARLSEGKCHAMSWLGLRQDVNEKLDVKGVSGLRGLWVAGQWLSRADLGNMAMALGDKFPIESMDMTGKAQAMTSLEPLDVLKAAVLTQKGGPGYVANVHNNKAAGTVGEIWNQPFVASDICVEKLSDAAQRVVLEAAKAKGINGVSAKLVSVKSYFGNERFTGFGHDHEGAPVRGSRTWNMYAIENEDGSVYQAILANDPELLKVARTSPAPRNALHSALPVTTSDPLLEYVDVMPSDFITDAMEGNANEWLDRIPHAKEFRFFMGTILKHGVTGETVQKFEAELSGRSGKVFSDAMVEQLVRKYPGIANAYSPSEWAAHFAPLGLTADRFGAAWPH